jgi:hypothetical protein
VDDRPVSTLLAVVSANALAVEWVPRVVNYNFSPDMGRMTA